MKSITTSVVLLLFSINSVAQKKEDRHLLHLELGKGTHGTGDIKGYNVSIEYKKKLQKRLAFLIGFGSTIHSGKKGIFYQDQNGQNIDGSFRYTTSGMQLMTKIEINLLRKNNLDIGLRLGALARYQSSSYYDDLTTLFPIATGLPYPVLSVINKTPQETLAIGAIGQAFAQYKITKRHFVGLSSGFQLDSNGDTVSQISLTTGITL